MVSLTVLVDLTTLDTKSSPATGKVHVRFGDVAFPERDWDDFVVRVLGWWLEDARKLIEEEVGVLMSFMDGPFAVRLEPSTQLDRWRATAQQHDAPDPELPEAVEINPREFTASLGEAARAVLGECNRRRVKCRDVKNLAAALDAFATAVTRDLTG
jgi:hypothetical protein